MWDTHAAAAERHYDALIPDGEGGTFLLSYASPSERPWALLGAQRWSDGDLLRVNNRRVRIVDAIASLEILWTDGKLCKQLVAQALLGQAAAAAGASLTDQQLAEFVETFRRTMGLCAGAAFEAWLRRRGLSYPRFLEQVADRARVVVFRRQYLEARVSEHFQQHRHDFDVFTIAEWRFVDRESARMCLERLATVDFWQIASACVDEAMATCDGLQAGAGLPRFRTCFRRELPVELTEQMLADAGQAPVLVADGLGLLRVLGRREARLDGATQSAIEELLSERWLEELLADSRVEWNWGEERPETCAPETGRAR